jgi:hypothetical protein
MDKSVSAKKRAFPSLLVCAALLVGTSSSPAQTSGKRLFATREHCVASGALPAGDCRHAHANALAEQDEKAPRFATRPECEKEFSRCMIAGFGGRRVEFQPALRGFEVSLPALGEKTVLPVLYVDGSALGFRPRPVSRPDASISQAARETARAKWREGQRAAKAAASRRDTAPEPSGQVPVLETPAPPSLYDIESAARRRKAIESAPTVR